MLGKTVVDRLNYSGNLSAVISRLCRAYMIDEYSEFSVIEVGYEDCNVIIKTPQGRYVAKIFSKNRKPEDIIRYSAIMENVVGAGINHPSLIKTAGGDLVHIDSLANGISMVLMKFIVGKSFLELDRAPDEKELQKILEQAAKINKTHYHPSHLFDSWAIPNIQVMFDRVKEFIKPKDILLIKQAVAKYSDIPVDALPYCFVHGDFTKANILKCEDGLIYIIDFAVANWYPRIQELAVIIANLLHDINNPISLHDKCEMIASRYSTLNPLTPEEKNYLYAYALAGMAMEFMGSYQEKYINGSNTKETAYWLNLGREGLRKELG